MGSKLQMGELERLAPDVGVDPDEYDSYSELRDAMDDDILECRVCGDEYVHDLWGSCCSDACQVEHHREMGWA